MEDIEGPSTSKKVKRSKSRSLSEKQIVLRVFHCLERDHQRPKDNLVHMCCNSTDVPPNNQPGVPTSLTSTITKDKLVDMCSDYTGVPKSSVYKILRENKIHGEVQTPKTSSGRKKSQLMKKPKTVYAQLFTVSFSEMSCPLCKKFWRQLAIMNWSHK